MHICAEIIKFDPENGYTLRFLHGPYAAGEDPDFKDRLGVKKPAGATSKPKYFIDRVKPEWISVDMSDQYGTDLYCWCHDRAANILFCFNKRTRSLWTTNLVDESHRYIPSV